MTKIFLNLIWRLKSWWAASLKSGLRVAPRLPVVRIESRTKVSLKQLSSYIESEFETVPTLDTFPNTLLTGTWAAVTHFHQLETEALSKKSKQFSSVFLHLVWAQGPYIRLMSSWYRSCTNTSRQISSAKYDTKVANIFRKNLEWKIICKFICSGRLVSFMAEVT